jgi:hypothetical protein
MFLYASTSGTEQEAERVVRGVLDEHGLPAGSRLKAPTASVTLGRDRSRQGQVLGTLRYWCRLLLSGRPVLWFVWRAR